MSEEELELVYSHCSENKSELLKANRCGCFNCMKLFNPKEIEEWIKMGNDKEETAFCPYCAIDSVIAECNEYILNENLLEELHERYMS